MAKKYTIEREDLLKQLSSVSPGIAIKENLEQSSCFIFQNGVISTYNGELGCRVETSIGITGAVKAKPLLELLNKIEDDTLTIFIGEDGYFTLQGQEKQAGVALFEEILCPLDQVEVPDDWKELKEEFSEAIAVASQCVGTDDSRFATTCIHIHPKWIEATDNYQLVRFKLKTPITESFTVKGEAIKDITAFNMSMICETSQWVHFKNKQGLVYSLRKYDNKFPDLTPHMEVNGDVLVLPKGIINSVENAKIFSAEDIDRDSIKVKINDNKILIVGKSSSGYYKERKKCKYEGDPFEFYIKPNMLADISQREAEAIVDNNDESPKLKVDNGRYVYVTCLEKPEEYENKPAKEKKSTLPGGKKSKKKNEDEE